MKRVLTAVVFGGLLTVLAPQAISAGTVTPSDHGSGQSAGDCAGHGQPQEARPEGEAPRGAPQQDRRGEDTDEDEILF
jgi:hypothetical protein